MVSEHTRIRHGHVAEEKQKFSISLWSRFRCCILYHICTYTYRLCVVSPESGKEARIIIKVEAGKNKARRQLLKNDARIYIFKRGPREREEKWLAYILFKLTPGMEVSVYLLLMRAQRRPIYGRNKQQFGPISGKRAASAALFIEPRISCTRNSFRLGISAVITSNYSL
jgi:hypothetical protein